MTPVASRLAALVVARAGAAGRARSAGELIQPLARFAPAELTPAAWREQLVEVVRALQADEVLDAKHQLRDAGEVARRIGRTTARDWKALAERVLPGLALGIAADDGKRQARLAGRDAWAAAIVGRVLGLWRDGPPPSLPALCDALAWRELGLLGKPKRCPPEIRALFVQRQLHSDPGPPERLVGVLAAREVGAPSPALGALRDALVRAWLAGRVLGEPEAPEVEPGPAGAADPAREASPPSFSADELRGEAPSSFATDVLREASPPSFATDVLRAAGATRDGWFGDRKVFVSAVWHELRRSPGWSALPLDEFKARLVAAHRAGALVLARADLVAAMDPELVAASEIVADGASFHFLVKEPVT